MAAVVKKPPATGRETPTGTPQRPTARSSTPTGSTPNSAATNGAAARPRPSRTSTPVSARASIHQRRESLRANGPPNGLKGGADPADLEREESIRAETVAIIDDLRSRLETAERTAESTKRQVEILQDKLDEAHKEQAKLEEKVHEHEEHIETLTNEKREAARQMREMENIYEAERSAMMKEKDEMGNREEEMQAVIQRLKDSLAQRNLDEDRPTRQSVTSSPSIESGSFAPPSSIQRSDSRNNSKLLLQKDKMIESLRLELAEAQIKLVESQNQGGGRLQEVERLLMEARVANARLMEDNESYQLLLQDRTLKGDFGTNDFSYLGSNHSNSGASANQDALAALEGRASNGTTTTTPGTSLADELSGVADSDPQEQHQQDTETQRRLEAELKSVKDQNKALTLYINKIIERLLQHQGFEHILDQSNDPKSPTAGANTNKELPPPPNPQARPPSGSTLLQRAKTMATGGVGVTAPRPKPRPMSFMPSTVQDVSNPDTAPSIPIGLARNTSTRRARPMSDQYTSATSSGAASIVNAMYKGPSGGSVDGPLSPSIRSSQTFFQMPQGAGNRSSAGGGAVTSPMASSGNFPGMRSETSSTSGDSILERDFASLPSQSPPRSQHEKEKTTFGGNKPRPLRLVQENAEAQAAAAAANKRSSWMGWAASAFAKKEDGTPAAAETIKE
ncbi:hypothetical protein QBC35DRAFT_213172 [Podospora australis]|uniref:M protein, serotype 2.1 n=1 Tax=Podospora australis TaxID=1536484 RepID=A0AAN7AJ88_9PEZI|nr:hypothetical protein QBC35DRAFT_213172 [Podospora australis]